MIKFCFDSGPIKEKLLDDTGDPITIGRSSESRLQVLNEKVSRNHCVIFRKDDHLFIRDLQTTNGTFVNGVPVTEKQLALHDRIRVGDVTFTLVGEHDPYTPPESDSDVFIKMRHNKGYETIYAETMGEAKKRDYSKILENKPQGVDTTFYLKKSFKTLGYTDQEANTLIREATGRKAENFPPSLIVRVQSPKYNELVITTLKAVEEIKVSQLVRYNEADYLVIEIQDKGEPDSQVVYRLKMC